MVRMVVRHKVADYASWRRGYDEFNASGIPASRGVRADAVYQGHDPNDVTVMLDFDDGETARAFFQSPDMADVMRATGVDPDGLLMSLTDI